MIGAERPRTEAGRALVARTTHMGYERNSTDYWRHRTILVEREARAAAFAAVEEAVAEAERDTQGAAEKGGDFTDGAEWVVSRVRYALAAGAKP